MRRASNRWTEAAQVAALFALLAATQAGACDFGFYSESEARKLDGPIEVLPDCSFSDVSSYRFDVGQYLTHSADGGPARDRGNGRIGQVIGSSGVCSTTERLLFVDCTSGEAVLFEGRSMPPAPGDVEIGGFIQETAKAIQPPHGPISITKDATVSDLVAKAKANGINYDLDVKSFFGAAKKRDRYDFRCGCKLFYPGSPGAGG